MRNDDVALDRRRPSAGANTIELVGRQRLIVERRGEDDFLRLVTTDGSVSLVIQVTSSGPVVRIDGTGLKLEVGGAVALEAEKLSLVGREELVLASGGDMEIHAKGDLQSTARIQTIKADLGNVNVKANDDVRIDGERVLVNCVDT